MPIAKAEMMEHLESMQGSSASAKQAASEGDFDRLQKMQEHGADILGFQDPENQGNTLLHFAVKTDNLQLVKFIRSLKNVDFDVKNANGETALHMCCGQKPNEELAKFLVLCGASVHAKNALGDTPVTLSTRFGHTELTLMLNTSESQQSNSMMGLTSGNGGFFGSTSMTAASSNKPPTSYQPYHPGGQAQQQ